MLSSRIKIVIGAWCTGAILLPASGHAAGVGEVIDFTIPQQYLSPRALGMGGAFIALSDDYNATLYNPAGLARIEEAQINLGINGMVDSKVMKLKSDLDTASKSGQVADMTTLLDQNVGNYYGARAGLQAAWARPRWGLIVSPLDLSVGMAIHRLGGLSLDLIATQDTTIAYGRGWDAHWFQNDRISFGATGKFIYRGYFNRSFLAADLVNDTNLVRGSDAQEGLAFDLDLGTIYTPKPQSAFMRAIRPSIGFVVRNAIDAGFTQNLHVLDKNSGKPPSLGRRFDIGTLFELPDWWIFKTRALADIRDIGAENFTFKKGSHIGAEFLWKVTSWWQGGWRIGANQGYFTAGFTGTFAMFTLDLVTYAEEVGPSDAPQASRRYALRASLDW